MAQEFTINSSAIETKINQLLPSQGGFGAGVDFSASTMVIPIVDLTESAEGSNVRQDIQSALSLTTATEFSNNSDATLISTTGYFRVIGTGQILTNSGAAQFIRFQITDGTTTKSIWQANTYTGIGTTFIRTVEYDFICLLKAGDSLQVDISDTFNGLSGSVRQIADVNGNLVNP
jgi:hypothetical protein